MHLQGILIAIWLIIGCNVYIWEDFDYKILNKNWNSLRSSNFVLYFLETIMFWPIVLINKHLKD